MAVHTSQAVSRYDAVMSNQSAAFSPSWPMSNMPHRTLLITGASRGIGAATAVLAARHGWHVALNYRTEAATAESVAAEVALTACSIAIEMSYNLESPVSIPNRRDNSFR